MCWWSTRPKAAWGSTCVPGDPQAWTTPLMWPRCLKSSSPSKTCCPVPTRLPEGWSTLPLKGYVDLKERKDLVAVEESESLVFRGCYSLILDRPLVPQIWLFRYAWVEHCKPQPHKDVSVSSDLIIVKYICVPEQTTKWNLNTNALNICRLHELYKPLIGCNIRCFLLT